MKPDCELGRRDSGFILIAVLWVVMLLAVFAMNHATNTRLGALRVQTVEQLFSDAHVLRSALAWGEHETRKYHANLNRTRVQDEQEAGIAPGNGNLSQRAMTLYHPRYEPYEVSLAGRTVHVRMTYESGKLNINRLNPATLEAILTACGVPAGVEATGIVNSILDWIDEDDLHRAEGAESSYYMALEHPYPAKNQPLESIEELLLIKGITPELYDGGEGRPGLVDFLTVSGQSTKMDVNSASPMAFSLVSGMSEGARQRIAENRDLEPVGRLSELAQALEIGDLGEFGRFFDVISDNTVIIEAWFLDLETGRRSRTMRHTVLLSD